MAAALSPPAAAPQFLARADWHDFLARAGWHDATIVPLAGDASFRRYFRVHEGDRRAVLMDAPPPEEDTAPFLHVARHLTALGFAAPAIFAEDAALGLVLLEDFGDARLRETLDVEPAREDALYRDAVALLADLHATPPATLPAYSRAELHREVALFTDWYCPLVGLAVDTAGHARAWDAVFDRVGDVAPVTVLRDYHAENIMLRDGQTGRARLGLLDFQDALVGHPAYDLVSLLQDARRDVAPAVEAAMLAQYRAIAPVAATFDADYAILGAQRNAKIIGIFARLSARDGKPRYLDLLPRVWTYFERDLDQPVLEPVRAWFDANVPDAVRAPRWT